MTAHRIYGLGLAANVSIAGLQGLATDARADITLTMGEIPVALSDSADEPPFYVSDDRDERGEPLLAVSRFADGAYYRLRYADGTCVVLDEGAERIWAAAAQGATVEDTAAYVLGPALGFALQLRGITCLHASSVCIDGIAAAFVGGAGAGKSTLAAAFARRGFSVLTDDVAPLVDRGDHFEVQPAYPRIRLWPDSVESLFGRADALPRISPTWEKRFLALDGSRYAFASAPATLAEIFVLGPRALNARTETLSKREALMALVPDTYSSRLLDRQRRAREFDMLARLVDRARVSRLIVGDDPSRIDDACELVERHLGRAGGP